MYWQDRFKAAFSPDAFRVSLTLVDQAVASATNFLSGVIIGRACAKDEFGLYLLGFTILLFALGAQSSLISIPYTLYYPRFKEGERRQYTGSTLIFQLALSLLVSSCLVVIGLAFSFMGLSDKLKDILWTLAGTMTFIMFREYFRQLSFALGFVMRILLFDTLIGILQIAGLLLLVKAQILSASLSYLVIGTSCALVSIVHVAVSRSMFSFTFRRLLPDLKCNWFLGRWAFPSNLTGMVSTQLYPWLLSGFHGTAATGALAACMGVINLVNPFYVGVGNFLAPRTAQGLARGGVEEIRALVKTTSAMLGVMMIAFCVLMATFGERFVVLIYGGKYAGNGLTVFVLALGQFAQFVTLAVNYALLAMQRAEVEFRSYVLSLCFILTLGLWLIQSLGSVGVAYSILGGNAIACTYRWIVFKKHVAKRF